jgi:prephenate dehydrogenase
MSPQRFLFRQVTIVGLGLMGGSLGMAIRRRRLARTVVGLSRSQAAVRQAKRRGAIDWGTTDAQQAVAGADLVVLATPVDAIVPLAKRLAGSMRPGSVLTDVGSTKAAIVQRLSALPGRVAFIGGHPIAGSEQRGITAADPDLFDGSLCILTPAARTSGVALSRVKRLWARLASRVVTMDPRAHDRLLGGTSHLPHLIAFALAQAVTPPSSCAPRSFLDMTRVAKSDPELWDDIFLTNRGAILSAAGQVERHWKALRDAIVRRDRAALRRLLTRAKTMRDALKD